jgi:hypothetical protein
MAPLPGSSATVCSSPANALSGNRSTATRMAAVLPSTLDSYRMRTNSSQRLASSQTCTSPYACAAQSASDTVPFGVNATPSTSMSFDAVCVELTPRGSEPSPSPADATAYTMPVSNSMATSTAAPAGSQRTDLLERFAAGRAGVGRADAERAAGAATRGISVVLSAARFATVVFANPSSARSMAATSALPGWSASRIARACVTVQGRWCTASSRVAVIRFMGSGCRIRTPRSRSDVGWCTFETYGPTATTVPTGSGSTLASSRRRVITPTVRMASLAGLTTPSGRTSGQPSVFHWPASGASRRTAGSGRSTPSTTSTPRGSTTTASTGPSQPSGRQPISATPPTTVLPRPHDASAARTSAPTLEVSSPNRTSRTPHLRNPAPGDPDRHHGN